MNQKNETPPIPAEAGAAGAMGVALVVGGRLPELLLAIAAWSAIRRLRPATPSPILFVTSIIVSETLLAVFAVFFFGQIPAIQFMLEVVAIFVVGLLLFFTQAHLWAYVLLAYCGYTIVVRSLDLFHRVESQTQNFIIGAILARIIMAWVLFSFIRPPSIPPVTNPIQPSVPPELPPIIPTDNQSNDAKETP